MKCANWTNNVLTSTVAVVVVITTTPVIALKQSKWIDRHRQTDTDRHPNISPHNEQSSFAHFWNTFASLLAVSEFKLNLPQAINVGSNTPL